tara:strand:- start:21 stop:167 length:147 start_codon:yes stop_codon:yes gene_type:complete
MAEHAKQAKTRKPSELSKIEQNRLAELNFLFDELRRGKKCKTVDWRHG